MAITATLQKATPHSLEYLLDSDAGGGVLFIDSAGGATPDLATDVLTITGPMKRIGRAGLDGIGVVDAGGFDVKAKSDALLLSSEPVSVLGNETVPRATTWIQAITANDNWIVTTAVAFGRPLLQIVHPAEVGTALMIIRVPHSTAR